MRAKLHAAGRISRGGCRPAKHFGRRLICDSGSESRSLRAQCRRRVRRMMRVPAPTSACTRRALPWTLHNLTGRGCRRSRSQDINDHTLLYSTLEHVRNNLTRHQVTTTQVYIHHLFPLRGRQFLNPSVDVIREQSVAQNTRVVYENIQLRQTLAKCPPRILRPKVPERRRACR